MDRDIEGNADFEIKKETFSKGLFEVIVLYVLNKMRSFIKRQRVIYRVTTNDNDSHNKWRWYSD